MIPYMRVHKLHRVILAVGYLDVQRETQSNDIPIYLHFVFSHYF